tara:strand:- start:199 stop:537 length:339 start_codon:yes stop_codon:yes gene_type:complete
MKSSEDNRGNEFCAKSSAKLSYATSSAKSSYNTSTLIKSIAKHTNYNYRAAIARNEKNPFDELERKVLNKLRPNYSFEDFKKLQHSLLRMSLLDKVLWLRNTEDAFNAKADS